MLCRPREHLPPSPRREATGPALCEPPMAQGSPGGHHSTCSVRTSNCVQPCHGLEKDLGHGLPQPGLRVGGVAPRPHPREQGARCEGCRRSHLLWSASWRSWAGWGCSGTNSGHRHCPLPVSEWSWSPFRFQDCPRALPGMPVSPTLTQLSLQTLGEGWGQQRPQRGCSWTASSCFSCRLHPCLVPPPQGDRDPGRRSQHTGQTLVGLRHRGSRNQHDQTSGGTHGLDTEHSSLQTGRGLLQALWRPGRQWEGRCPAQRAQHVQRPCEGGS